MRFRRALDRGNVTEAFSAAGELQFVGLAEALELTLLLVEGEDARYERAALRWHARFVYETKNALRGARPGPHLRARRLRRPGRGRPRRGHLHGRPARQSPLMRTDPPARRIRRGGPKVLDDGIGADAQR